MHPRNFLKLITSVFIIGICEYSSYSLFNKIGVLENPNIKMMFVVLGIVLPIIFIITVNYNKRHFSKINSLLYTIGTIWFGAIFYVAIISSIVYMLLIINQDYLLNLPIESISIILLSITIISIIYGIFNANNPRIVRWTIESPALSPLWKDKKIIVISDIHFGSMRKENFMHKIVNLINSEKPDVTFNLGDFIDGPAFDYKKVFAYHSELNPPLGNYYVEGNHEGYSKDYQTFRSNFPKNLNDITNKKVIINGTQIIGMPYNKKQTNNKVKNALTHTEYDKKIPSIILMHHLKKINLLAKNDVSLVLSGHTHGGQFFPLTIILKMMHGKYLYGINYILKTVSITSSGAGSGTPPIRVGTSPEIILLTIK